MPEEGWDNQYENHDIIRLDCSRFIWPKYSFIRKCTKNYFDNKKEKEKKSENKDCNKYEFKENNVKLENKYSENVRECSRRSLENDVTSHSALNQTSSCSSSTAHNNTTKNNRLMDQIPNTSIQVMKSEDHTKFFRNSPINNLSDIGKKRNRDIIYSDEEGSDACYGSDDDQCGNSLFFQVSKYGGAGHTVRTVRNIV